MTRTNLFRAACLALSLGGAAFALHACDGGNDGGSSSTPPTAAELKTACDAVFDKVISCGGLGAMLAPMYKASVCTDANAASFAECTSARALLTQAKGCEKMDCSMASSCGLGLVSSLQACLPDGGM